MDEAGHERRARERVLRLRVAPAARARAQGAHVHAEFDDAKQWVEGRAAGKRAERARRDEEGGGRRAGRGELYESRDLVRGDAVAIFHCWYALECVCRGG